jgi:hypothetical protein
MRLSLSTSKGVGFRKITASSAYMEARILAVRPLSLERSSLSIAICSKHWRGSMAKMKRRGRAGPPGADPGRAVSD